MSKIVDVMKMRPGFLSMKAPKTEKILQAEEALKLQLAGDYREYVAALGTATYMGHELTGICAFPRLDVVTVTQQERQNNPSVPADWYVIEQANIDNIVIWQDASGAIYQTMPGAAPQKICSSLSEYVML